MGIKRFVLEDFGLKFISEDVNNNLIDHVVNRDLVNKPFPLFTLVLLKNTEEDVNDVDLGTLNHVFESIVTREDSDLTYLESNYSFISNIVGGIEKYKINSKGVLNIRTDFNGSGENGFYVWKRDYRLDNFNDFYTYLATILIELDPL